MCLLLKLSLKNRSTTQKKIIEQKTQFSVVVVPKMKLKNLATVLEVDCKKKTKRLFLHKSGLLRMKQAVLPRPCELLPSSSKEESNRKERG